MTRKDDKERVSRLSWTIHYPQDYTPQQRLLSTTWIDGRGIRHIERRADPDTLNTLSTLRKLAKNRDITGMAAVTLRPDGRFDVIVTGTAYGDSVRATGAGQQMLKELLKLLQDDEGQII